ncbi:helix-turn-helix domain-containing protein [Streptomyces sp. NPDC048665]|uniref:helix-turn-helix domain-containing protein n=1 Tax=Streptomyces sp. NPDC048665 TaxID=3155490 RepID=UPI0034270389
MVNSPKLPIGRQVRHYRRKNGNRSQAAIAGLCGITERYLSLIETGKKTPSPDVLTRLARELGVPVSALLSDEPPAESGVSLSATPDIARALMGYKGAQPGRP